LGSETILSDITSIAAGVQANFCPLGDGRSLTRVHPAGLNAEREERGAERRARRPRNNA